MTLVAAWIAIIAIYSVTPRVIDPGTKAYAYWPTNYAERQHVIGIVAKVVLVSAPTVATTPPSRRVILTRRPNHRNWSHDYGGQLLMFSGYSKPGRSRCRMMQCPSFSLD